MDFAGMVALVTGASRRIGAAVAMGQRGAAIVINCFSGKERAERVAAQVEAAGGRALAPGADVRDRGGSRLLSYPGRTEKRTAPIR
ncbi:SDR family NAD(P)-dependent oxidoreductase [Nitrospinota bacterium]